MLATYLSAWERIADSHGAAVVVDTVLFTMLAIVAGAIVSLLI